MSHPIPGHDYTEKHNQESNKEYKKRVREGTKKVIAKKMKKAVDNLGPVKKWKDKDGYHAYAEKHDVYDQFASAGDRKYRIGEWKKESVNWKNK